MYINMKHTVFYANQDHLTRITSKLENTSLDSNTLPYVKLSDLIMAFGIDLKESQDLLNQTSYQIELEARKTDFEGANPFHATWFLINEVEVEIKAHLISKTDSKTFELLLYPLNAQFKNLYVNK
jgi:hypothetical protein